MVKCMLKSKSFPNFIWGEAMLTTTYIPNKSLTRRLKEVTPKEVWTEVKPKVTHLKIFGSMCYKCVPNQLRRKLDDK